MGLLSCCFNPEKEVEYHSKPAGSPNGPAEFQKAISDAVASAPLPEATSGDDAFEGLCENFEAQGVPLTHPIEDAFDASQLHALQEALASNVGIGFEARASEVTALVREHLGNPSIVRLFGLASDDDGSEPHQHLVQLAASASTTLVNPQYQEHTLPGSSFTVSLRARAGCAKGASAPDGSSALVETLAEAHRSPLLMERALRSKKPVVYRVDRSTGPGARVSIGGLHPDDCRTDLLIIRGQAPLTFAALPLTYCQHVIGALWIVVEHAASQLLPSEDADQLRTSANGAMWRRPPLLSSLPALTQLALAASMSLAGAVLDPEYMRWLAEAIRRLATSTCLHTLVSGVCAIVARHIRTHFHTSVAVQSALVPDPESHIAFMLWPESKGQTILPDSTTRAAMQPHGDAAVAAALHGSELVGDKSRPKSDFVARQCHKPLPHTESHGDVQRLLQQAPSGDVSPINGQGVHVAGRVAAGASASTGKCPVPLPAGCSAAQINLAGSLFSPPPGDDRDWEREGKVDTMMDGPGMIAHQRSLGASSTASGTAVLLFLSAKAFQMSHTLLARLLADARSERRPALLVPPGIIVADTARHVADVWQPSRDVCMLMGSKATRSAVMWQAAVGGDSGAGVPSVEMSGSRGGGAASLVLLGMEVAKGGCMMGLYVAFPMLTPQPLLEAVQESSRSLLNKMLVHLVRHKVQGPELGPAFKTLRAGVPGSYMSTLRINDAADRAQTSPPSPLQKHLQPSPLQQQVPPLPPPLAQRLQQQQEQDELLIGSPGAAPAIGGLRAQQDQQQTDVDLQQQFLQEAFTDKRRPMQRTLAQVREATAPGYITSRGPNTSSALPTGSGAVPKSASAATIRIAASNSSCTGRGYAENVGSQDIVSARILISTHDMPVGAGAPACSTPAAMMTVHDLDETWGMRGMMGALVESIMTTLRASVSEPVEAVNDMDIASRAAEGLEDLQLSEVLGHGASGVVLRGVLGTVPVAVKLMEMPDADQEALLSEACLLDMGPQAQIPQPQPHIPPQALARQQSKDVMVRSLASMVASLPNAHGRTAQQGADGELEGRGGDEGLEPGDPDAPRRDPTESKLMRARRNMLRNATELAVMRIISHVNIVQAFAVYDNVVMERAEKNITSFFILRRLDPWNPDTGGSPICTAIVQELCDRGSLADVLADGSFPITRPKSPSPSPSPHRPALRGERPGGCPAIDMRTVYLTLLEIALALRHLHARRLVHRDLKPANVLLKTSPGDPRGWTCKLADFGFALVLDKQETSKYNSSSSGGCTAPTAAQGPDKSEGPNGSDLLGNGSAAGAVRGWYTIQTQVSGTLTHMAPEAVVKNSRIDASVDIYAFGIMCWELVCGRGRRPFCHLLPEAIPAAVLGRERPLFSPEVPDAYRKLAAACWSHDPRRRPRAADVVAYIKQQLAQLNRQ